MFDEKLHVFVNDTMTSLQLQCLECRHSFILPTDPVMLLGFMSFGHADEIEMYFSNLDLVDQVLLATGVCKYCQKTEKVG